MTVVVASVAALVLAAEPAQAAVSFGAKSDFAAGSMPLSVAVGDLDRDGVPDLAVANMGSDTVSVLLGGGDGGFAPKTDYATGDAPRSVAIADFDGDGAADLAVADAFSNSVSILLGNGDGTFAPRTAYATGSLPRSVAVADVDRDGAADLVTANTISADVSVLLGNGDGSFAPKTDFAAGDGAGSVAVGDLDGDGAPDVVTANHSGDDVSVLLGNGDGTFAPKTDLDTGVAPESVAIGDLDRDGAADLAVANHASDTVSVLMGDGAGAFAPRVDIAAGDGPSSVAIGDADRDGRADLIVAGELSDDLSVLSGNGDGSFAGALQLPAGDGPYAVALADLDRDGRPDLATANHVDGTASVLLNATATGFGRTITFASAPGLATGDSPYSVAIGDVDRDGTADMAMANTFDNTVSVVRGNGDGTFGAKTDYAVGVSPRGVALRDLDRDGALDLAVANLNSGTVSVRLGNGDGTFGALSDYSTGTGSGPSGLAIADVNRDGALDVATANLSSTTSVLLGNGDGSFAPATGYAVGSGGSSVAIGDLDRDGSLDLAVARTNADAVSVLLGNGNGTFAPKTDFAAADGPRSVAIGDLDRDGAPDLAVAGEDAGKVSVLIGAGDGSFAPSTELTAGAGAYSVAIADLDRDGAPDLAVANSTGDSISVLQGDGDGTFAPKTDFAAGDSPFAVAVGDLDRDGRPDLVTANINGDDASVLLNTTDVVAPETQIEAGPAESSTVGPTPTFEFSASEPGSTFECRFDGEPFAACSGPGATHTASGPLAGGGHTFEVRAIDPGENSDPTPADRSFIVDATPPAEPTFVAVAPASPANDNAPRVSGIGESTIALYATADCSGAPAATGSAADFAAPGIPVAVADNTTTTFRAVATDANGNASGCSSDAIVYVEDSNAPDTSIDGGPADGSTIDDPRPEFAVSASEPDTTFACQLDGGAWVPCGSTQTTGPLADGPHTFAVRATDRAGNTDPTAAQRTFTVASMPSATFTAPASTPAGSDTSAPVIEIVRKRRQRAARAIKIKIRSSEAASVVASGTVMTKARRFKLRRLRAELAPQHALTLRLRLEHRPGVARLNRLVRRGAKARARIRLKATDAAGNPTSRTITVHLTR